MQDTLMSFCETYDPVEDYVDEEKLDFDLLSRMLPECTHVPLSGCWLQPDREECPLVSMMADALIRKGMLPLTNTIKPSLYLS